MASPITAAPAAGQRIEHDGKEYTTVKEGLAYILIPADASTTPQLNPKAEQETQSVFYNPIQQFNRDLTVLAIKAYGEEVMERKKVDAQKAKRRLQDKRGKKRKRGDDAGENSRAESSARPAVPETVQESHDVSMHDAPNAFQESATKPATDIADDILQSAVAEEVEQAETTTTANDHADEEDANAGDVTTAVQDDSAKHVNGDAATPKPKQPSFRILDALSATGLRALRYAHELPFVTHVTSNDLLPAATRAIELNAEHNKVSDKITATTGNALSHMYSLVGEEPSIPGRTKPSLKYDVIDLDPYGTAATFLDAAVQAVRDDGGLLCVTCTDAGVWASNGYPEKCFSLYGGIPAKGPHSHEAGLRIILHAVATSAARYGLAIEPLLSLSIDYYARVFVRVRRSPAEVKFLAGKTMLVYNCDSGCGAWSTQLLARNKQQTNKNGTGTFYKHVFALGPTAGEMCEHCGTKTHLAGPMYAGPIHSSAFVRKILDSLPGAPDDVYGTKPRIEGMLTLALEEILEPRDTATASHDLAAKKLEKEKTNDTDTPTETPHTGLPSSEPLPNPNPAPAPKPLPNKFASTTTFTHDPSTLDPYPFFFIPSALAKILHCVTPSEDALRGALIGLGYRVTRSHCKPGSIKTDAPWGVVWDVMRAWVRTKAKVKEGVVKEGTAGWRIMNGAGAGKKEGGPAGAGVGGEEEKREIVFDERLGRERDQKKLVRYQLNPRENWGPMNRAKGH